MVDCKEWDAWYNRMPGTNDEDLHVAGKVGCPSSSIDPRLEPDNEGVVDDPSLFVLKLFAEPPPIGDDMYVEKDVAWADNVGAGIKRVEIRGACQAMIPVREAS